MSRGVIWSFLSAFLWGTTFVCARYLLAGRSIDPVTLSAMRFGIGGALLLVVGLLWRRREIMAIRRLDFARCLGLALIGIVGMSILLFFGQQNTSAGNCSIIIQTSAIFMGLLGIWVGERLTWVGWGALS